MNLDGDFRRVRMERGPRTGQRGFEHEGEYLVRVQRSTVSHAARSLMAVLLAAFGLASAQDAQAPAPTPEQVEAMHERAASLGLPDGVVQLTPCIPGMGEHWARLDDRPLGPIYGVMGDEVVFVELMPAQQAFIEGESWVETLVPIAGQAIDHVDLEFVPHGHEGFEVPHYDIHGYFVAHEEHEGFCPAG